MQCNFCTKDPFHGVSFGKKTPEIVRGVIEIPRGC